MQKHFFTIFISVAFLFLLVSNSAFAFGKNQDDGKNSATPRKYSVHDSNEDGYLDRKEFAEFLRKRNHFFKKQGKKNRSLSASLEFDQIDQDKNDLIDEAELITALNIYLQEHQRKRQHKKTNNK